MIRVIPTKIAAHPSIGLRAISHILICMQQQGVSLNIRRVDT
jgi:hypothetical protein